MAQGQIGERLGEGRERVVEIARVGEIKMGETPQRGKRGRKRLIERFVKNKVSESVRKRLYWLVEFAKA